MIAIFVILSAVTAAALVYSLRMNRELARRLEALADRQEETEHAVTKLSRKARRQTNTARKQEAKIERMHRKQREQADRQKRIEAEQRKQAQSITMLSFRISQAEADIATGMDRLSQLFALLDIAEAHQAAAMPGTAQDVRYQKQIVTLTAQIAATEKRIEKARFDRSQAQEGLAA